MIAAIMCGGRGSRLKAAEEKPLVKIAGKSLVERVLAALKESGRFERIVAVTSPNAPRTREFLRSLKVEVIETPGGGYPHDLSVLLAAFAQEKVLVVPTDLPLLTGKIVAEMVDKVSQPAPAVSIVLEKSFVEGLGVKPSVVVGGYCHSGITLFAGVNGPVEERYVVMNSAEIAVNVNTKEEKELAELLVQNAQDLARNEGL
ncbi:MAG: NTP transferase domain-containing protein [Nitrososphaera sp.]|uniref:NTP transferase domain-containing protein n=1 Tax=Nitrososphaera sp. TaxID=1971748 RepID=UPI003D6EF8A3